MVKEAKMLMSTGKSSSFRVTRWVLSAAVVAALVACGGGGGGTTAAPPAPTTAATTQFPLATAIANYVNINTTSALRFSATGTASTGGQQIGTISGSGTVTVTKSTTTFENVTAIKKATLQNGTMVLALLTGANSTIPLVGLDNDYFDTNYSPLGYTATGKYCAISTKTALPAVVKVGDSGNWYTLNCYTSSSKTVSAGRSVYGYRIVPFDATSAILKITFEQTLSSGSIATGSYDYKMTTTGAVDRYEDLSSVTQDGITISLSQKY
jgi:hypothetical protein